jgi:hypothetical protein
MSESIEEQVISVNDLKDLGSKSSVDVQKFEGERVRIEGVTVIDVITSYDETGTFVQGLQRKTKALKVYSVPIASMKVPSGEEIQIRASELFNLKFVAGTWGVSNHESAKISKLLKKFKLPLGMEGVKQLPGQSIIIRVTNNHYLGFVY